jgi:putative glutamine amidotransferase
VVLAGGADIDPARYGEEPHPETTGLRPDRDDGELDLVKAAFDRDLPVLGICRGMQIMTVAAGGHLIQHLPDALGHDHHRPQPGVLGEHEVRLDAGSQAAAVLGSSSVVKSYHHQGVSDPGWLAVTGHADDGSIEVVEASGRRFAIGVLWHPEAGDDLRLFQALIDAARGSMAA